MSSEPSTQLKPTSAVAGGIDRIAESKLTGRPVVALCGKIWVPKHDPSQYPVCPDCKRIYEEMMK